jgi:tRNA U34 2-thiouridine synthase MnmA/TrmU
LVWDAVVFTPRGDGRQKSTVRMSGVHSSVTADLLEVDGVDVPRARLQLGQPSAEAQESHPAALEPLRPE